MHCTWLWKKRTNHQLTQVTPFDPFAFPPLLLNHPTVRWSLQIIILNIIYIYIFKLRKKKPNQVVDNLIHTPTESQTHSHSFVVISLGPTKPKPASYRLLSGYAAQPARFPEGGEAREATRSDPLLVYYRKRVVSFKRSQPMFPPTCCCRVSR